MKEKIIMFLVSTILKSIKPEDVKLLFDKVLDSVESVVIDSSNEIDDQVVMPIVGLIREAFDIPDTV